MDQCALVTLTLGQGLSITGAGTALWIVPVFPAWLLEPEYRMTLDLVRYGEACASSTPSCPWRADVIVQPVFPRVPLVLQASGGIVIDPLSGAGTINPAALTAAQQLALITSMLAALPTSPPPGGGPYLDNGLLTVAPPTVTS